MERLRRTNFPPLLPVYLMARFPGGYEILADILGAKGQIINVSSFETLFEFLGLNFRSPEYVLFISFPALINVLSVPQGSPRLSISWLTELLHSTLNCGLVLAEKYSKSIWNTSSHCYKTVGTRSSIVSDWGKCVWFGSFSSFCKQRGFNKT